MTLFFNFVREFESPSETRFAQHSGLACLNFMRILEKWQVFLKSIKKVKK